MVIISELSLGLWFSKRIENEIAFHVFRYYDTSDSDIVVLLGV